MDGNPSVGMLSLVFCGGVVCWIHWDDLQNDKLVGRRVKVEGLKIRYTPPAKLGIPTREDFSDRDIVWLVPNCGVRMVRARGELCPSIDGCLDRIRNLFEAVADNFGGCR